MTISVPLPGGHHTLIDDADAELVTALRWRRTPLGYVARNMNVDGARRTVYLHRFLMGLTYGDKDTVDHINRDKLDNRRANLRVCTQAENVQNLPAVAGSTSLFRGVQWSSAEQKWIATVRVGDKQHRRRFATEVLAALAAQVMRDVLMPFAEPDPALVEFLGLDPTVRESLREAA